MWWPARALDAINAGQVVIDGMVMKVGECFNSDRSDSQTSSCACFFLLGRLTGLSVAYFNHPWREPPWYFGEAQPTNQRHPRKAQYMQGKGRGRGAPPATATVRNLEVTSNSASCGSWGCDPRGMSFGFFQGSFLGKKTGKKKNIRKMHQELRFNTS